MVLTMANELHATGKATALLGICAAGGLGAAALLENAASRGRSSGLARAESFAGGSGNPPRVPVRS
jgi:hypothetical protein